MLHLYIQCSSCSSSSKWVIRYKFFTASLPHTSTNIKEKNTKRKILLCNGKNYFNKKYFENVKQYYATYIIKPLCLFYIFYIFLYHLDLHTGRPIAQSVYTRCCINTIVLLRISTELLETCR
jgi:hypothetical protein